MTRVILFALLLSSVVFVGAQAQTQDSTRELIYSVNAFQGSGWKSVFYPQSEETIYLLAGQTSTLTPRFTMVYFWPITQRYYPDWPALDELIEARMELRAGTRVIGVLELSDYVLQGPASATKSETRQLYTGEEAHACFKAYQAELDEYWEALDTYFESQTDGNTGEGPTPPQQFSTKVLRGFLINLEPGTYNTRLIDANDQPLPGSEKKLVVFAPRRHGVGYEIIPESKWTVREVSATPEETIYVSGQVRLFFVPHEEAEYNAQHYEKLLDPQAPAGDANTWKWVPLGTLTDLTIHLAVEGQKDKAQVPFDDYVVHQSGRAALGYQIESWDQAAENSTPSFSGHAISLTLGSGQSARLWLVDAEDRAIADSERTLRDARDPFGGGLQFLPAIVPLIAAAGLVMRKERRRRRS
ncbi:MAG: hypothetical protein SWK90_09780 [Chloroflexota bacterium]|nr:hypothetical protein [Chloroflexota bacterium]